MLQQYASLIQRLWTSELNHINPNEFFHCIADLYPQFGNGTQQDAHEFLAFLLDILHEDLNRVTKKPYITEEDPKNKTFSLEKQAGNSWKNYLLRNKSIIVDLFQGQLKSTLRCLTCGYTSNKFESFMYLSVPVSDEADLSAKQLKEGIDLSDCIKEFTKEEMLEKDEKWLCPICKDFKASSKKIDIWKCPNILIIHLKRFKYTRHKRGKIRTLIKSPIVNLDLEDLVAGKQKDLPLFDLFAVCNHEGTLGRGHYTTLAKNKENNQWNFYNDGQVYELDDLVNKIITRENYLLFYSKTSVEDFRRQSITQPELWPHFIDKSDENPKDLKKKAFLQSIHNHSANTIAKPRIIDKKLGIKNKFHKNIDNSVSFTQKDANSTPELKISELMNKKKKKKNEGVLPLINEHKKGLKTAIFVLENSKNFMSSEQRKKLVLSANYRDISKKNKRIMIRKKNGEDSLEQSQDSRVFETPEIFNFKGVNGKKRGISSANCFVNFQLPHSTSQIPEKFEL